MKKYLLLVFYSIALQSMQKKTSPVKSCQIFLNEKHNAIGLVKDEWHYQIKPNFFACLASNLVLSILNEIISNQQIVNPDRKKILDYIKEYYSPKTWHDFEKLLEKSNDYELWEKILKSEITEQFQNLMSQQRKELFFEFKKKLENEFPKDFVENIIQSDEQIDLATNPWMFWKN